MKNFLEAIDLLDTAEEECKALDTVMEDEDLSAEKLNKQSGDTILFYSLSCVEKLIENQNKKTVVGVSADLKLPETLVFFASRHSNHWVRQKAQKVISQILVYQS